MTCMQNIIYYIWNLKTYLCTDRICAYPLGILSPVGPIPNLSTVTAAPLQQQRKLLRKPHTCPASTGGLHGALAWPVSLGSASSSRIGMAEIWSSSWTIQEPRTLLEDQEPSIKKHFLDFLNQEHFLITPSSSLNLLDAILLNTKKNKNIGWDSKSRNLFLISWIKIQSRNLFLTSWIKNLPKTSLRTILEDQERIKNLSLSLLESGTIKSRILNQETPFLISSSSLDFIDTILLNIKETKIKDQDPCIKEPFLDFLIPFLNNSRTYQETPKSRELFSLFGNQETLSWFLESFLKSRNTFLISWTKNLTYSLCRRTFLLKNLKENKKM